MYQYHSQCRIQQFFWGAGFSTSVARGKTVLQLGNLGGGGDAVSPPRWGPGTKPHKFWLFCILNKLKTLLMWLDDNEW